MLLAFLIIAFLILLNAFFVLTEFSIVKIRPTQVAVMAKAGSRRARCLQLIQASLDKYLAASKVGISLVSIALGFVAEPMVAEVLADLFETFHLPELGDTTREGLALTIAFVGVTYVHIVLGELTPKVVALRRTRTVALWVAYPIRVFRAVFIAPLWLLDASVGLVLLLLRIRGGRQDEDHTEQEVRVILGRSQGGGMLSFRRLLLIENILDLGGLTLRNAMQPRHRVVGLRPGMSAEEILSVVERFRYSRYPLLVPAQMAEVMPAVGKDTVRETVRDMQRDSVRLRASAREQLQQYATTLHIAPSPESEVPAGYIHLKELYPVLRAGQTPDLPSLARPVLRGDEDDPLEEAFARMQRTGNHIFIVFRREEGREEWTGMVTLEDALEEMVGTIEEEFPTKEPVNLRELLTPQRTHVQVPGRTVVEVANEGLRRLSKSELPEPVAVVARKIAEREDMGGSYLGRGLAVPHARLEGLPETIVMYLRPASPLQAPVQGEVIDAVFLLLTPADQPRVHQQILARIAGIFMSDFLEMQLRAAANAREARDAICTAEQAIIG